MGRNRRLTVVEVGKGSSRSRQSMQEELEVALMAEQARVDTSDDDETQPPGSLHVLKCNV